MRSLSLAKRATNALARSFFKAFTTTALVKENLVRIRSADEKTNDDWLFSEENLRRATHDFEAIERKKIAGNRVPDARTVLVPLASINSKAHVLLTVQSTRFGTQMLAFPRGHRSRHTSERLDKDAIRQCCDQIGGKAEWADPERVRYLGTHHDAVNAERGLAITPGVAYFGAISKREMRERNREANCVLGVVAVRVEDCLVADNISVVKLSEEEGNDGEEIGPMPAFSLPRANVIGWGEPTNEGDVFGLKNCLIWGSDAAILHGVLRVLVGSDARYKETLYKQYEKIRIEMGKAAEN